jgi:4-hydroxy-tetrahydrodipicolinate reductase
MVKLSIYGARGRMGQSISRIVLNDPQTELVGLIEEEGHEDVSGVFHGIKLESDIVKSIEPADVVIDFSTPDATMRLLGECSAKGKGMVIGTTGLEKDQLSRLHAEAEKIPIIFSPNMSIGVNLMFKIAGEITSRLPDYDKEIIEAHHNLKADSPSGTAMELARVISVDGDRFVTGREGKVGPRKQNEIGIHAVRAGSIVGEHTVVWAGLFERLELTHRAQTREVFAYGAVKAAVWLSRKKAGRLYNMEDVLS